MSYKVSVIVPVYNVEKFLSRCLDSLIRQTLEDIEIICVNDSSTDNSLSILQYYAKRDARISVISQANQGVSVARNTGMKFATGEYIGFVDSDDWIDLNFYEKLYNAAKKEDADIACCSSIRVHDSGRKLPKVTVKKYQVITGLNEKFRVTNTPRMSYVWNKIYRRKNLLNRNIKFPVNVTCCEDVYFTIDALYSSRKIVTVPEVLYYYWVNTKSATRTMTDRKNQDVIAARAYFIDFAKKHGVFVREKFFVKQKVIYSLFGIPLLKIYEWETKKHYYLFSLFKVFEKQITL